MKKRKKRSKMILDNQAKQQEELVQHKEIILKKRIRKRNFRK